MLMNLLQITRLVGGGAGAQPQGRSLCPFPSPDPENPGVLEVSMNCLGFWNQPRSGKVTTTNSIFPWPLLPWQDWESLVMLPLVRAGTGKKDGLGLGSRSHILSTSHQTQPQIPALSGPPLTWHMGAYPRSTPSPLRSSASEIRFHALPPESLPVSNRPLPL